MKTHGHAARGKRSRTYRIWLGVRERCRNTRCKAYEDYGAQGIDICDAWYASFPVFLAAVGECPSTTHQLDRIDGDKGYEPGNVRWLTPSENSLNRKSNRILHFRGIAKPLTVWARLVDLKPNTLAARLRSGWTMREALLTSDGICADWKLDDLDIARCGRCEETGTCAGCGYGDPDCAECGGTGQCPHTIEEAA